MVPDGGEICRCGKRGCLETLVSEPAIIKQARQIAEGNPNGQLAQFLKEAENSSELELIFDAARYGDKETLAMIDEKACYLGLALENLVNILNPELIILGGMFSQGEDLFLPPVIKSIRDNAFAGLGEKVSIATTGFGWRAGVVGASSLALTKFFYLQGSTSRNSIIS